jgi:ABC-type uncharacterized transport system permease subunit
MFWPLFLIAVLASALSLFTGAAASLACAVIYAAVSIRRRVDISPVRTLLILIAPAFGLLISAAIFLSGPGF